MTMPETERTCFFVGVSGYMELATDEIDSLTERLRQLFRFLRDGAAGEPLHQLVADLVPDAKDTRLRHAYRAALSRWTGLGNETPIVVLCNLAPGVDTLVAKLVLDEFAGDNFHLLCPLPFPPHIYIGASTFVRFKDGHPVEGNRQRQQDFLQRRVGPPWPDSWNWFAAVGSRWCCSPQPHVCHGFWLCMRQPGGRGWTRKHENTSATFSELKRVIGDTRKRAKKTREKAALHRFGYPPVGLIAWTWQWLKSAGVIGLEIVNIFLPSPRDSAITQTRFGRRLWHCTLSFLAYLPLSLVVACAACGMGHLIAGWFETFPGPLTLSIIIAGTLLLGGALAVAWAEKNLHSELAYQYNTMATLFEAADQQLDKSLTDFQTAIEAGDDSAQRRSIQRIQALLFKLGQESLDENAEWLLLHRARPLEPVMAG